MNYETIRAIRKLIQLILNSETRDDCPLFSERDRMLLDDFDTELARQTPEPTHPDGYR